MRGRTRPSAAASLAENLRFLCASTVGGGLGGRASHAFHPLDGFAQSTPYHAFVFLFPMNKLVYLLLFVFVNCWTISIHDGVFVSRDGVLNSCAHHSEHHLHFTCNYGQYFTFWDRLFGTHKTPDFANLDPSKHVQADAKAHVKAG